MKRAYVGTERGAPLPAASCRLLCLEGLQLDYRGSGSLPRVAIQRFRSASIKRLQARATVGRAPRSLVLVGIGPVGDRGIPVAESPRDFLDIPTRGNQCRAVIAAQLVRVTVMSCLAC